MATLPATCATSNEFPSPGCRPSRHYTNQMRPPLTDLKADEMDKLDALIKSLGPQ